MEDSEIFVAKAEFWNVFILAERDFELNVRVGLLAGTW